MIKRHSWQIEYLFWYSEYISFSPQALKINDDTISFAIISEAGEELFLAKVIFSSPPEQQDRVSSFIKCFHKYLFEAAFIS